MESTELKHWIAFNRVSGVGRARIALIEGHFGSLERAWKASTAELIEAGLDRRTAGTMTKAVATIDPDDELARVQAAGVRALTWHDEDYPPRLKEIYDKPPVLNVRGSLSPDDERAVAVVGTRRPTAYGRQAAYQISHDLARSGVTIVSGLARGNALSRSWGAAWMSSTRGSTRHW